MVFTSYPSSPSLRPFIQCYLEADARTDTNKGEYTLFPNGFSGVFFNFGNIGSLFIKEEHCTPAVSVFGQIDRHFTAIHWPGFYSIGVVVKPTLLSHLLQVDMSEFTNKTFDGSLIMKQFQSLHEQLGELDTIKNKIRAIEKFFLKVITLKESTIVDNALLLLQEYDTPSVAKLAYQLNVSERYLEAKFKSEIGLSPKAYSMIIRFKRMEWQLRSLSTVHWQDMTFANEYHDQNHFIKDFKRFTGHTPSDYLIKNFEMGQAYLNAR